MKQEYTGKTATKNIVVFEAMGYSSNCSEQEYTEYTATENLVELLKSLVKQEYTRYTATKRA